MEEKKLLNEELENAAGGAKRDCADPVVEFGAAKEGLKTADGKAAGSALCSPQVFPHKYAKYDIVEGSSVDRSEYVAKDENDLF